jgi:HD-GYP domain-containing protein (c-di-GMP phosphodiesterase class II)
MSDGAAARDSRALDTPLYNSRITNTYLKLVRKRYPQVDIGALLAHAGMEAHQVADEGHWFTQRQVNRFQEKLRELTGNPHIAREAGLFSASPEALGGIGRYILGLVSPERAYTLVGKFTKKFTRSVIVEPRSIGKTSVEIVITPRAGVREEPFQCENRMGYMESVARHFNYSLPHIDHPECVFKGGGCCKYIVTWQPSFARRGRRARLVVTALLVVALGAAAGGLLPAGPLATAAAGAALLALLTLLITLAENRELKAAVSRLEDSSDELLDQINVNYQNALMVNEVGQTLSKERNIDDILEGVVDVLERRLDYDRGVILLANPEKSRLVVRSGYGYPEEVMAKLTAEGGFRLDRPSSRGVFVVCFRDQRSLLVNDIAAIERDFSRRSLEFARATGVKSFICCPIVYENESLGVLAVDNYRSKRPLLERDVNLLMGIAPQIGICMHNARLTETRVQQFQSIIQALVASTEARDPITAGHSQKVTEYSIGICREMGLPYEYTEMIRVAAALHDYGKIGIYDAILKKPGRLTSEEYEIVKTHAAKTREILQQIRFEGIYRDVPSIAGAHHEKIDGTGYPNRLRGDSIPLGARIIAVADVFEALTSKRHYREPMALPDVFQHLVDNSGAHFDRTCVDALIRFCETGDGEAPRTGAGAGGVSPAPGLRIALPGSGTLH